MRSHASRVAQTCFTICAEYVPFDDSSAATLQARLVTALVLSRLDYCNAVLAVFQLPHCWHRSSFSSEFCTQRHAPYLKPRDRVTLRELHWLPVAAAEDPVGPLQAVLAGS